MADNSYAPAGSFMRLLGATLAASGAPSYDPGAGQRALSQGLRTTENFLFNRNRFNAQERARQAAHAIAKRRLELLEAAEGRAAGTAQARQNLVQGMTEAGQGTPAVPPTAASLYGDTSDLNYAGMPPAVPAQPGMTPQQYMQSPQGVAQLIAAAPNTAFASLLKPPAAPTMQTVYNGTNAVQQRWNPTTRQFVPVGSGPRFNPATGGASLAQKANNAEVDTARAYLFALRKQLQPGESLRDYISRASKKASDTGRSNPVYDPMIDRIFRTATQRKVGDDQTYDVLISELDRPREAPPSQPTTATRALQNKNQPGVIDRALDFFGLGSGSAPTPPAGVSPHMRQPGLPNPSAPPPMQALPNATGAPPMRQGRGAPPQAAVDYLKQHPELAPDFDKKYGKGAAQRTLRKKSSRLKSLDKNSPYGPPDPNSPYGGGGTHSPYGPSDKNSPYAPPDPNSPLRR